MSRHRKGYPSLIIRTSLLIGYLFFFAAQSNYQYFDIANFFIYGHDYGHNAATGVNTGIEQQQHVAATAIAEQQQAPQHSLTIQASHQRVGHLAIDKRFHFQQGVRIPPIRAPGATFCLITGTPFCISTPAYSSAYPPTNALRGPPSAA